MVLRRASLEPERKYVLIKKRLPPPAFGRFTPSPKKPKLADNSGGNGKGADDGQRTGAGSAAVVKGPVIAPLLAALAPVVSTVLRGVVVVALALKTVALVVAVAPPLVVVPNVSRSCWASCYISFICAFFRLVLFSASFLTQTEE